MLLFGDMVNVHDYHIHSHMLWIEYRNSAHSNYLLSGGELCDNIRFVLSVCLYCIEDG